MKIKTCNKEIWWQFRLDYWKIGIEIDFDFKKYKYISINIHPLLIGMIFYMEWD